MAYNGSINHFRRDIGTVFGKKTHVVSCLLIRDVILKNNLEIRSVTFQHEVTYGMRCLGGSLA